MRTLGLICLLTVSCVATVPQEPLRQAKAQAMAANFNKHKDRVKEKYGVRTVKYLDVRSEPVVRQNLSDYAGAYQAGDLGYVINIRVASDGNIQINGNDQSRSFRIENARIEGALLTGSKIYQDGINDKFEGVFINRTSRNSVTDVGVTKFGLGVVLTTPVEVNGNSYDRMFFEKQ